MLVFKQLLTFFKVRCSIVISYTVVQTREWQRLQLNLQLIYNLQFTRLKEYLPHSKVLEDRPWNCISFSTEKRLRVGPKSDVWKKKNLEHDILCDVSCSMCEK